MLIADHAYGNAMCSEGLIAQIGNGMDAAGLCGREDWRLPAVLKPGLDATGDVVFPDAGTAGRQIFRLLYSLVSAATLAAAVAFARCSGASRGSALDGSCGGGGDSLAGACLTRRP